jgi:hypothetical protein
MRAAEFMRALADIIDKLDGNDSDQSNDKDPQELEQNPVFVPPLQQHLELAKAEQGKESPVIDKITADDKIGQEPQKNPIFRNR